MNTNFKKINCGKKKNSKNKKINKIKYKDNDEYIIED